MRFLMGLVLAGLVGTAQAQQALSLGLSDESAQVKYARGVGESQVGGAEAAAGLLFDSHGNLLTEIGLNVFNEAGTKVPGLVLGLGGKVFFSAYDDSDILALALGAQVNYPIPSVERFVVHADAYYAPDIVTFKGATAFRELALRGEYEFIPQGAAFLEWRQFAARINNSNENVDSGMRVGFRIKF